MVIEAFNLQVKTGLSPPLFPGAMSLVQLPYELVAFVVQDLDLADIRNLSYSCKKFRFLVEESQITKQLLQVNKLAPSMPRIGCVWLCHC